MKTKVKENKKEKLSPLMIVVCVILAIYVLTLIFPLVWGFITSLKSDMDFSYFQNYLGLPNSQYSTEELKFGNYITVLEKMKLPRKESFYSNGTLVNHNKSDAGILIILLNTILYCGGGAIILAFMPFLMAYMVTKFKYKFSKIVYATALVSMVIPSVGTYAAELTMLRNMGLYDSIWGNYLQKAHFSGQYFFVFCAYFSSLSDGYSEAATIDGASNMRIFINIIIPLSFKMILTIFMLDLVALWNDYQTPLLYLPTFPTLAYAVHYLAWGVGYEAPMRIATSMLLAIPMIIFFVIFKDKIMGNVTMGGLKE